MKVDSDLSLLWTLNLIAIGGLLRTVDQYYCSLLQQFKVKCKNRGSTWFFFYFIANQPFLFLFTPQKPNERNVLKLHMQSQILGFGILIAATLFSLGLVCIRRCCFADDMLPNRDEFDELEKKILTRLFRDKLHVVVEEDLKKKINEAWQLRTSRDVRESFHKAKEALTAVNRLDNRNGRYNRLDLDGDDTELQLMDSTHL